MAMAWTKKKVRLEYFHSAASIDKSLRKLKTLRGSQDVPKMKTIAMSILLVLLFRSRSSASFLEFLLPGFNLTRSDSFKETFM